MTDFEKSVYEYLLRIPAGRVVTYGMIAKAIGCPKGARAVGNALHRNLFPDVYPCYKVVNGQGGLAKHFGLGIEEQKRRLEKDGVEVENYQVSTEFFWKSNEKNRGIEYKYRKFLQCTKKSTLERVMYQLGVGYPINI